MYFGVSHRTPPPAPRPSSVPAEDVLAEHLPGLLEKDLRHQVCHHPLVKLLFSGVLESGVHEETEYILYAADSIRLSTAEGLSRRLQKEVQATNAFRNPYRLFSLLRSHPKDAFA